MAKSTATEKEKSDVKLSAQELLQQELESYASSIAKTVESEEERRTQGFVQGMSFLRSFCNRWSLLKAGEHVKEMALKIAKESTSSIYNRRKLNKDDLKTILKLSLYQTSYLHCRDKLSKLPYFKGNFDTHPLFVRFVSKVVLAAVATVHDIEYENRLEEDK